MRWATHVDRKKPVLLNLFVSCVAGKDVTTDRSQMHCEALFGDMCWSLWTVGNKTDTPVGSNDLYHSH